MTKTIAEFVEKYWEDDFRISKFEFQKMLLEVSNDYEEWLQEPGQWVDEGTVDYIPKHRFRRSCIF